MAKLESREGVEPRQSGKHEDKGGWEGSHVESIEQKEPRA